MDTVQYQALSVVFFPQGNIDNKTLYSLLDFLRGHKVTNIKFNNTFPLSVPAPFPLMSANVGLWQMVVNGQRVDFSCTSLNACSKEMYTLISEIFESCFTDKINRLGLVAQFKCFKDSVQLKNKFLASSLASQEDLTLNSLAYVKRLANVYDNIQILKSNEPEVSYICVRDLNTGILPQKLDKCRLNELIAFAVEKFSLESISGILYGEK